MTVFVLEFRYMIMLANDIKGSSIAAESSYPLEDYSYELLQAIINN